MAFRRWRVLREEKLGEGRGRANDNTQAFRLSIKELREVLDERVQIIFLIKLIGVNEKRGGEDLGSAIFAFEPGGDLGNILQSVGWVQVDVEVTVIIIHQYHSFSVLYHRKRRKGKSEGGDRMDAEKITRLEDALLNFVERATKESATKEELRALPAVADVLAGMARDLRI